MKSNQTAATERPWFIHDNIDKVKSGWLPKNHSQLSIHSSPTHISCIAAINRHEGLESMDRANAALIVKAINLFDEMAEMIKQLHAANPTKETSALIARINA